MKSCNGINSSGAKEDLQMKVAGYHSFVTQQVLFYLIFILFYKIFL